MAIIKNPTTVIQVSAGALAESDVNFYDYDGTLLYAYSKNDFLALSSMPSNPTHSGLTAQGWNWTLSDAKTYVNSNGMLSIGQVYTTASGKNEFDIELTVATGLSVTLNMDGTKDWGDGSTPDTSTTHTYTNYGKYTISCDGTVITSSTTTGLFGQTQNSPNYYCTNVRLSNVSSSLTSSVIPEGCFRLCESIKTVIISNTITALYAYSFTLCASLKFLVVPSQTTTIGDYCFANCYSLTSLSIPNSCNTINNYAFQSCYSLSTIFIPNSVTSFGTNIFRNNYKLQTAFLSNQMTALPQNLFYQCYTIRKINIPNSISSIDSSVFYNCWCMIIYDFSNHISVPTLSNTNAFNNINKICKIIVPDSLYTSWIADTTWSALADYIYKASEVTL